MKLKTLMIGLLFIFIVISAFIIFDKRFLVVNEKPKKADVIVVLSGGGSERLEKGASLYHDGYADYVLLTDSDAPGMTKENAMALDIPEDALIEENKATSTYTNALYSKEKMEEYKLNSAIVVTSDYHTRRTKLSFDRVFNDTNVDYSIVAAPSDGENGEFSTDVALREYWKYIGYILGLYKWIDL